MKEFVFHVSNALFKEAAMNFSAKEVKQFLRDNDVKFVKLTFCDVLGRQKNVSIVADEMESVLSSGFPISEEAVTLVPSKNRLKLVPDPATLSVLPWRPQAGRVVSVLCRVDSADGSPCAFDSMGVLSRAAEKLEKAGLSLKIGTSCDFYVLKTDDGGDPIFVPYDDAGYCDAAPLDRCENIRRDIILNLETMGLKPTSSRHERGYGQNRIVFRPSDPMTAARNLLVYKSTVRNICVRDGAYATFMPMPFADGYGSGMHLEMALSGASKAEYEKFARGIEGALASIAAFADPTVNSYRRLDDLREEGNAFMYSADKSSLTCELYLADNACNPYPVFALLITAGLMGLSGEGESGKALPTELTAAIENAAASETVKRALPAEFAATYLAIKREEAEFFSGGETYISLAGESDDEEKFAAERAKYIDC